MDIVKVFGKNVKKYRLKMNLSQEAFAERCGMHRTYENIQRIADALEVDTFKLFVEDF